MLRSIQTQYDLSVDWKMSLSAYARLGFEKLRPRAKRILALRMSTVFLKYGKLFLL
jgi:hypothetical protein